jgi:hypothetical protein
MADLGEEPKACPACHSAAVVRRRNQRTGTDFLGCLAFPRCRWTYSRRTPTGPFDRRYDQDLGLDAVLSQLSPLRVGNAGKDD